MTIPTRRSLPLRWLIVALCVVTALCWARLVCGQGWVSAQNCPNGQCAPRRTLSIVRVSCKETSTPYTAYGSGTIVRDDGQTADVLTAAHTFDDAAKPYTVYLSDGRAYRATMIAMDRENDLCALRIRSPGVIPVRVQPEGALTGMLLATGYGAGNLRSVRGQLSATQYTQDGQKGMYAMVRSGDSGGPIIAQNGVMVGVLWGVSDGETHFMTGRPLARFLDRFMPGRPGTIVPRLDQKPCNCGKCNRTPPPDNTTVLEPTPAQPNPENPNPPLDGDGLKSVIVKLDESVASLNAKISEMPACDCEPTDLTQIDAKLTTLNVAVTELAARSQPADTVDQPSEEEAAPRGEVYIRAVPLE